MWAVLTTEWHRAMMEKVGRGFSRVLVLANETGHLVGSIRQLRWSDVHLDKHTISWRAQGSKLRWEHVTMLSAAAVAALKVAKKRTEAIGDAWIFLAPGEQGGRA